MLLLNVKSIAAYSKNSAARHNGFAVRGHAKLPHWLFSSEELDSGDRYLFVTVGLIGGPCRDRTCDHLIKSQMHKSAFKTAITVETHFVCPITFFSIGFALLFRLSTFFMGQQRKSHWQRYCSRTSHSRCLPYSEGLRLLRA